MQEQKLAIFQNFAASLEAKLLNGLCVTRVHHRHGRWHWGFQNLPFARDLEKTVHAVGFGIVRGIRCLKVKLSPQISANLSRQLLCQDPSLANEFADPPTEDGLDTLTFQRALWEYPVCSLHPGSVLLSVKNLGYLSHD